MRQGEVVKHEQVARAQRDLDLYGVEIQAERLKEAELGSQFVELHSAEKAGRGLDARELRRAGGALKDASQAALAVAIGVIPRAV